MTASTTIEDVDTSSIEPEPRAYFTPADLAVASELSLAECEELKEEFDDEWELLCGCWGEVRSTIASIG